MAAPLTPTERLERHPIGFAVRVALATASVVVPFVLWVQHERIERKSDRIAALEKSCEMEDVSTRRPPGSLALAEFQPTRKWLLYYLGALSEAGTQEEQGGAIATFRVAALRMTPFSAPTPPLTWRLRSGAYDISADHAFLVSADGMAYTELRPRDGSASELVYTVPPARQGDFLLVPALLSSRTDKTPPPVSAIVATLEP